MLFCNAASPVSRLVGNAFVPNRLKSGPKLLLKPGATGLRLGPPGVRGVVGTTWADAEKAVTMVRAIGIKSFVFIATTRLWDDFGSIFWAGKPATLTNAFCGAFSMGG